LDSGAASDSIAVSVVALPGADSRDVDSPHAVLQAEPVGQHRQLVADSAAEPVVDSAVEQLAVDSVAADMVAAADTAKIWLGD
jgi:NADPH-dependent ferric siderophore reductase